MNRKVKKKKTDNKNSKKSLYKATYQMQGHSVALQEKHLIAIKERNANIVRRVVLWEMDTYITTA